MNTMPVISEHKLNAPFRRTSDVDRAYLDLARKVAQQIDKGEEPDVEDLRAIRLDAAQDREYLKGDIAIAAFLDALQWDRWEKGKMIKYDDAMARGVYKHHYTKERTKLKVTEYCRINQLTRNKYYRILDAKVKHEETRKKLLELKEEVRKQVSKI